MRNGVVIPNQDMIAVRDRLSDCKSALECIFMAAASFDKEEMDAIQYVVRTTQENFSCIKELLGGSENV